MKAYNMEELCVLFEKGIKTDYDREILGESLFYYCCGKDPTPIIAFSHTYPLYIYADVVNYGGGDFYEETHLLYERLKGAGFTLLDRRELKINKRAVLTMWNSPQKSQFFLLYVGTDARQTFQMLYSDNNNYIQPKCICNYRYEMPDMGILATVEKRAEYILGHCSSKKYQQIAEYDYCGDYEQNTTVPLFRRMFWYVY